MPLLKKAIKIKKKELSFLISILWLLHFLVDLISSVNTPIVFFNMDKAPVLSFVSNVTESKAFNFSIAIHFSNTAISIFCYTII